MAGYRIEFFKGQNRENRSYQKRSRKKKFLTVLIKRTGKVLVKVSIKEESLFIPFNVLIQNISVLVAWT